MQNTSFVIVDGQSIQVAQFDTRPIVLVSPGLPGAKGDPGSAGVQTIQRQAAQAISGHTAVAVLADNSVVPASSDDPAHVAIGITTGAVAVGGQATVHISGEISEPSWAWDVSRPIFVGIGGVLTQTAASSGIITIIGYPSSPTSIIVEVDSTLIGG